MRARPAPKSAPLKCLYKVCLKWLQQLKVKYTVTSYKYCAIINNDFFLNIRQPL